MSLDPEQEARVHERATKLHEQMRGDPRRLATVAAQFQLLAEGAKPEKIEVVGGVSGRSGEPYVQFLFGGDFSIQQDPDEAYEFARNIVEAATNAAYDAALFAFARQKLGLDEERAAMLVGEMRDFRQDRWGAERTFVSPDEPRG